MRSSPTTLVGGSLVFSRDGRRFVAVDADSISVVDLATDRTTRIALAAARAVAAFDDQLWIAAADDRLLRLDYDSQPLGAEVALPFAARAILEPAACGTAAAVWSATPAVAALDDFGQLVTTALPDADVTIPLTGRRFVTARGAKLALPSGHVTPLPPNTSVLGGAVASDGKTVTLLVAQSGGRQLLVVALGTGQIVQCCAVPGASVRLAARRGLAIAHVEPRLLWILDLHAGREVGTIQIDHDVHDLAIDPDGRRVALRCNGHSIELALLADLLRRPPIGGAASTETVSPTPAVDDAPSIDRVDPAAATLVGGFEAADVPSPVRTAAIHTPFVCARLTALEPQPVRPAIERSVAIAQLERELHGVALWALRAIANAWDSRKLGYGNEGRHPYELEVAAILGTSAGFATDYLAAAAHELGEHERALAGDPMWRSPATPVGALVEELALDVISIDILLVVAAAALWGEIARLYGILANDTARPVVDELLVQEVLAHRHDRHAIAAALDPRAPLVRLGVVQVGARRARPFAELVVDGVILDRLRAVAPDLGPATTIRTTDQELGALDIPRTALDAAVTAVACPPRGTPRILVRGRVGTGRRTLLAALAVHAGRALAVIDAQALPPAPDPFVAELARCLRRAQLSGLVPCIANLGDVAFAEHAARDLAAETLRLHPGPIAVIAAPDEPAPFGPGHIAIELPVLGETERRAVWQRVLADAALDVGNLDSIAARYRIGPGMIRQAAAAAREAGGDPTTAIDAFVRQTRDVRLGQYARRVERLASWSSVVLPPDILDSLRELVARVRHGRQVYESWGMGKKIATSRGLTALFQGQPGTGKTLVAGVIARELGLDLYQVDLSKVMSKWIGETERNLSTIFDAAEDGQVVLLFDEADSLFAKRTEVRSSNDRYANLEVNYLLQRLDAFAGIAILTTNIGTSIDQAFKRRMSFRLSFPFPDEDTREQLWRAHLPAELPVTGPLALDALARKYQIAGGYIRNACLRAAFLAAQDETSLHQHHLERAVALEYAELGKLSSGGAID